MICILNYGLGNVQALHNIYTRMNFPVMIASTPDDLRRADKIILPGVGAFDWAMARLNDSGLRIVLDHLVLEKRVPILGICVGMQMMARSSDEGVMLGLGWMNATVKRFDTAQVPHMGWNDVTPTAESPLFSGISEPRFYFLHSYYFAPDDTSQTIATSNYVGHFTSAAANRNIFGVQFHPEKSHEWGIHLLDNFARI